MKTLLVSLVIGFFVLASSCTKPSINPNIASNDSTITILGKWYLINDSIANYNNYYLGSDVPNAGNFIGGSNDYFYFATDTMYLYLNNFLMSTNPYMLLPNNGISISSASGGVSILSSAHLLNFTKDSVTIYGSDTSLNGGVGVNIINLKR
jgi:hypothetical protein